MLGYQEPNFKDFILHHHKITLSTQSRIVSQAPTILTCKREQYQIYSATEMAYNEHCTQENKYMVVSRVDFTVFKAFVRWGCLHVSLAFAISSVHFSICGRQWTINGRDDWFDLQCTLTYLEVICVKLSFCTSYCFS